MSSFKPSVKTCQEKACPKLKDDYLIGKTSGKTRKVCSVNNRIPGNLSKCPFQAAEGD